MIKLEVMVEMELLLGAEMMIWTEKLVRGKPFLMHPFMLL